MRKVLIVDDELLARRMLKESIVWEEYGYSICGEAANGKDGLEKAVQLRPDMNFVDIKMPVIDGFEATREIRKLSLDVPIIAVTAFAYASDEQRAMENGFAGYMAKPISAPQLRQQIAAILQKRIILL